MDNNKKQLLQYLIFIQSCREKESLQKKTKRFLSVNKCAFIEARQDKFYQLKINNIIQQLLNSAFVECEELCRSRNMLSIEAEGQGG